MLANRLKMSSWWGEMLHLAVAVSLHRYVYIHSCWNDPGRCFPCVHLQAKLNPLLSRAKLLITRKVEWASVMFSYVQVMYL